MMKVNVALPNGHAELLALLPSATVQDVRTQAQQAFGKKHLRLITAKNRVLVHFEQTLEEAEIEDGECLTALVLQPQLAATNRAFALWCHGDSAIVTWGDAKNGGDSSAVQDQRQGVLQIQATNYAFATILADGSVVTWGSGGDSSAVRDQLKGVLQIQATNYAFAAILADGSVVTWGDQEHGGDSSAVRDQLRGVQQIQATGGAFAAILKDGSVVTWGDPEYGGDSAAVQDLLQGVSQIQATDFAFAAILADGSVITWSDRRRGGDSSAVRDQLRGVQQIQATGGAFAAILEDGSVVAWGHEGSGGDSSAVRDQLRGVQQIQATGGAFAAILEDGSVVAWGHEGSGGDSSAVRDQLRGVQQIQATYYGAFAAILTFHAQVTQKMLPWGLASPDLEKLQFFYFWKTGTTSLLAWKLERHGLKSGCKQKKHASSRLCWELVAKAMPKVLFPHHTAGEEATLPANLGLHGSPLLLPNPTYDNLALAPKFVSRVVRFLALHGAQ